MSNSFELFTGSIVDIQKKYEILSDIITEIRGKIHSSQSHITATANDNLLSFLSILKFLKVKRKK